LQGFNKNTLIHEPDYPLPGAVKNLCDVEAECAITYYLFHRSRTVPADLRCLKTRVKRLFVTTLPIEAPSLVAIGAAVGFINFYKADEMSQLLKLEGFRRGKIYLKKPYDVAGWTPCRVHLLAFPPATPTSKASCLFARLPAERDKSSTGAPAVFCRLLSSRPRL